MPRKSHPMRPYRGALKTVIGPLGRNFKIKPRGSKKCIEGRCVDVVETRNQKHFFIKADETMHQFGEGAMVISMSQ